FFRRVKSFNPLTLAGAAVIEMNADKKGSRNAIGNSCSLRKGGIGVTPSGHDHREPACAKLAFQTQGNIQGEILFPKAVGSGALVVSSMSGIHHNGGKGAIHRQARD